MPAASDHREVLAPLLLRRFRLTSAIVIAVSLGFTGMHVWMREATLGYLLLLKALQVLAAVLLLLAGEKAGTRRPVVACLLLLSLVVNGVTAATGAAIGNTNTNALLYVVSALISASFLPWGVAAQAASCAGAGVAAVAPFLLGFPPYRDLGYDLAALAFTFAVSCFIAREVERDGIAEHRAQEALRELAESRATVEGVFQSTVVSLGLFEVRGDDFVFLVANEHLSRLFLRTPAELAGMTGRQLGFGDADVAQWLAVFRRAEADGSVRLPEYLFTVVGPPRWYEVSISTIRNTEDAPARFSIAAVEITERKQARDEVEKAARELEAKVRERTALLEAANKDLESFAYSVSHDLRTPLRSIEGFAALVEEEESAALSPRGRDRLQRIRAASRHMAQLIDDMLTLSRVVRGDLQHRRVDLTAIARDVAGELASRQPGRRVDVQVEEGLVASGDGRLLGIVMANLLSNAWKYTGRRESAQVRVGGRVEGDERVFFVRDDGCGFDMRFADKLFRPFQRLHAVEDYEGTGVGLATVARILRRHGGRVWAEGVEGQGATFWFALPCGPHDGLPPGKKEDHVDAIPL